jgi:peptidyl-prolyl cis-trans isomerase B (cyclophilin B)
VKAPPTENVPTTPATEAITLETSQGPIGIQLDRALSPCTVNSFVSLADQGFFNDTTCHRLTTGDYLQVLQCGDPTGTDAGGPGYSFKNEFPTDQFDASDPNSFASRDYKRGVVAMANAGADTNGSQFFLVYGDSILPPNYTIFGTMTDEGLATVEKVAAAGANVEGTDAPDGTPNAEVKITSVKKD